VVLVTVAHHVVEPALADVPAAGVVAAFRPDLDAALAHTVVVDRVVLTRGVTLSTAPVVVGGGRGVGSAEAFGPLEELADLLILILGHSLAMKIDLESEFHRKMDRIMQREARRGKLGIRVTEYTDE